MAATLPDPTRADHWWCADCGRWVQVDDRDLCVTCADEHALVRLLDMVLETDQVAYRLEEAHWGAWERLTSQPAGSTNDVHEPCYHAETQVALSSWLSSREQQRYTTSDVHQAGGGWGRSF